MVKYLKSRDNAAHPDRTHGRRTWGLRGKVGAMILGICVVSLLGMLSGCGGNGNTRSNTVNSRNVESTVTEISSTTVKVSAETGGTVTHKDLTITIPPGALEEDTDIKVALATIIRNGVLQSNGHCYKISTGSADNVRELERSATVTISADPSHVSPALFFWDGEEWINPASTYNKSSHKLTFKINCIYEDLNAWEEHGSMLEGPSVIEIADMGKALTATNAAGEANDATIIVMSSKNRFRIECTESQREFAKLMGSYLEAGYDYYVGKGFRAPVKFILDSDDPSTTNYIYIKITYSENGTAFADSKGILKLPTTLVDTAARQTASLHELFHLVEYSYSNRKDWDDWLSESETEGMSTFACNEIFNHNEFYDIDSKDSFFPGRRGFVHALDKFSSDEVWQYQNAIFWSYVMGTYGGVDKFRKFVVDGKSHNLAWLNDMCGSLLNESLTSVYAKAYEDYYVHGTFFNKANFYKLSARSAGQPYYSERQYAYSASENPYRNGKVLSIDHMSGRNVMMSSANSEGSTAKSGKLFLSLSGKAAATRAMLFYFSYSAGNGYELIGQEEIQGSKTISDFGAETTDVLVIMENLSFKQDNQVNLRAYALEN